MAVSLLDLKQTNAVVNTPSGLLFDSKWEITPYTVTSEASGLIVMVGGCSKPEDSQSPDDFGVVRAYWNSGSPMPLNRDCRISQDLQPGVEISSLRLPEPNTGYVRALAGDNGELFGAMFVLQIRGVDLREAVMTTGETEATSLSATSAELTPVGSYKSASRTFGLITIRAPEPAWVSPVSPDTEVLTHALTGPDSGNYVTCAVITAPGHIKPIQVSWAIPGSFAFASVTIKGRDIAGQAFVIG